MPIVTCLCECGKRFDDLIGNTISEALNGPVCPGCGKLASIVPCGNAIMPKGYRYPDPTKPMSPDEQLEHQGCMEHKAWMEANEHARDDGSVNMVENGPDCYRPFENRPRERKFY